MKCQPAGLSILKRLKNPKVWCVCIAFLVLTTLPGVKPLNSGLDALNYGADQSIFSRGLCQFSEAMVLFVLSPFAWQWTGKAESKADYFRGILQSVGIVVIGSLLLQIPFLLLTPKKLPFNAQTFLVSSCNYFIFIVLSAFIGFVVANCEEKNNSLLELREQAHEAQWNLLRSQLSPHLVLNTLSGIAGLAEDDSSRAARGLEDLAIVYQQLLELGKMELISLSRERELLERYLNVEKIRLEDNLHVKWCWEEGLEKINVPPLLVQPLVENAIKHGINASHTGGEIILVAQKARGNVLLEVKNTGGFLHKKSAQTGAGIGIKNLKKRLQLKYGERAALSYRQDGLWTIATINIPLH